MEKGLIAFGIASVALLIGFALRAKVPFLRNALVPAFVIGGFLALILCNIVAFVDIDFIPEFQFCGDISETLFTLSFLVIGLNSSFHGKEGSKKILKGSLGMGLILLLIFYLTPLIGYVLILLIGPFFNMDSVYGLLVTLGFASGPGVAQSVGAIHEAYGLADATHIGMSFSLFGFLCAFLVGVPLAKRGIKKGLNKYQSKLDESVLRGYYKPKQQQSSGSLITTHSGNIETLTFLCAIIGFLYILALGLGYLESFIPIVSAMSSLSFLNAFFVAVIARLLMRALKLDFLLDDSLLKMLLGLLTDFMVVLAFMSIDFQVITKWIIPLFAESVVIGVVTYFVCIYFGQRLGGQADFESTMALFGTLTGTGATGIALLRIVDNRLETPVVIELGLSSIFAFLCLPTIVIVILAARGTIGPLAIIGIHAVVCLLILALMKICKTWGKKTYSLK